MPEQTLTATELEEIGLIAIVRAPAPVALLPIAEALARGGIRVMEVTLNTPGALEGVTALRQHFGGVMHIGAGTILEPNDARRAMDVGAEFIVTPTLQTDTIALCRERRVPIACGAMTPTEALAAHRAGADFVKLFPADGLGPAYVRALRAPLPFLKIIPTGGVDRDSLADFIHAGCVGVALGSGLVSQQILDTADWERLALLAEEYVGILAAARQSKGTA